MRKKEEREEKPAYHAPCTSLFLYLGIAPLILLDSSGKLKTVISGHMGWVRSVAVEPGNQWFATGAGDRVIKVR